MSDDKTERCVKGNIDNSLCRWCLDDMPIDELCKEAKGIGKTAIDLVGPTSYFARQLLKPF